MTLQTNGTIEIPGAAGSSFDHGAFDPKTRRVFVAHTGRDCVDVIDHDDRRYVATSTTLRRRPGSSPTTGSCW